MKCIIAAVDFSAHSIAAARLAAGIAHSHGARLALVHALEPLDEVDVPNRTAEAMQRDSAAQARHELAALAETLEVDAVEIVVDHREPVRGILLAAAERSADLISMGSWGQGGGAAYRFGSVTARVVRDAACPVLVSRADQVGRFPAGGRFTHPLVAVDYSRFSAPGVRLAAALARQGATIEVIHIVRAPAGAPGDPTVVERLGRMRATEMSRLSAFSSALDVAPVTVAVRSDVGHVAEQILDYARQSPTDLLVVGAHGPEQAIELIGTSADRILRAAPVPVAILPPRAPAGS